jgi:type VI secretion system protein ImpD
VQNSTHVLRSLIAAIDQILIEQTSAIITNAEFRKLLSAWSCLYYLAQCADQKSTKIRILDLKQKELSHLVSSSIDNIVSHKILDEQEMPGNEPLSLIITSHIFDLSDSINAAIIDQIAQTCAYAFAPFLTGITASIFDAEDLTKLEYFALKEIHTSAKFRQVVQIAKQHYSNFLGLVMPEVYYPSLTSKNIAHFLNMQLDSKRAILGSGAFAIAAVIMQVFRETGWFLDMIGAPLQHQDAVMPFGRVPNLESQEQTSMFLPKFHTRFVISESKEKELADLGIIPLCQIKEQDTLVIYTIQTLRTLYFKTTKEHPQDKSHVLQPLLCVCRFAHYIRIIGRAKTGQFLNAQGFQKHLEEWLTKYVASNPDVERDLKRKYPLLAAKVHVSQDSFLNQRYKCAIYLKPHLLSSEVSADILLTTSIPAPI